MTKTAQVIRKKLPPPSRPKGTPSILSLFSKAVREQRQPPKAAEFEPQQTNTRNFASFDPKHPQLEKFRNFLRQLDGGRKPESEVKQITTDLKKFLKFARPRGKDPIWVDLLSEQKVREYIDTLESCGACGPAGQLTKLDRIIHGLRYLRLRVAGEEDSGLAHRCNIMQERLKQWKATIRPAKKLQQLLRKGDEGAGNVKNAVALVRCKELWCAVRDVLSQAATGDHPSAK